MDQKAKRSSRSDNLRWEAGAGEVIGGDLARDKYGRFVAATDVIVRSREREVDAMLRESVSEFLPGRMRQPMHLPRVRPATMERMGMLSEFAGMNREKVIRRLVETRGITRSQASALLAFADDGTDLGGEADSLTHIGLIIYSAEGTVRLSRAGRSLVHEMSLGNVRRSRVLLHMAQYRIRLLQQHLLDTGLEMETKSIDTYRSAVRSSVYGLWSGKVDLSWFIEHMGEVVEKYVLEAWMKGAGEVGIIDVEELTEEEMRAMADEAFSMYDRVLNLADYVVQHNKASGTLFRSLLPRIDIWVNRYNRIVNKAKAMAGGNLKMRWDMHPEKEHCNSCVRLSGKVKRARYWEEHILPQSEELECGGWACGCSLVPTDEPMSKGPLPKI